MRYLKLAAIFATLVTLALTGSLATPARADKYGFPSDDGRYYCVLNTEQTLAKGVCRNPRIYADYYVMYFDIDYSLNRVFVDTVRSTPEPGYYQSKRKKCRFASGRRAMAADRRPSDRGAMVPVVQKRYRR